MEISRDIINELQDISPLLATLSRVNVFTVPNGYFDSISITVLACLQEATNISTPEAFPTMDVPVVYFDNLSSSILQQIRAQQSSLDELAELSPLLQPIQKINVFKVPENYFEGIYLSVEDGVTAITDGDIELSPLLEGARKLNVFSIPENYFTDFSTTILKKLQPASAKIVAMPKRNFFVKYAVAAAITALVALGIYTQTGKRTTISDPVVATVVLDPSIEEGRKMDDLQYSEALNNLTEEDIASYLEKNGDIADVAALSNTIEDNKLPTQEDYLLDAKTLENYLDKLESTTPNN